MYVSISTYGGLNDWGSPPVGGAKDWDDSGILEVDERKNYKRSKPAGPDLADLSPSLIL